MPKKIIQEKKKVLLFLSVLIVFTLILTGCNWLGEGILNVFDPKAQIRVNFTEIVFTEGEGTINLEIYSINEVEFFGEGFEYKYYNKGVLIPELSETVGRPFHVAPSTSPGTPGDITEIANLPLFYQNVRAYISSNLSVVNMSCTINLIGTDGSGHRITKPVTFDLPFDYFPDITVIISANPASFESAGGNSTITAYVVDDNNQPVGGVNVVFATDGGSLSSTDATTGSNGKATTTLTLPENTTEEDNIYKVTAYVGSEESSTTITVKGIPENTGDGTCPDD